MIQDGTLVLPAVLGIALLSEHEFQTTCALCPFCGVFGAHKTLGGHGDTVVMVSRAGSPGRRGPGAVALVVVPRGAVAQSKCSQDTSRCWHCCGWHYLSWQLWVLQKVGGSG